MRVLIAPDKFAGTLTAVQAADASAEGWRRHSRDTGPWDMSRKPIHLWISHVRCVLGQVI